MSIFSRWWRAASLATLTFLATAPSAFAQASADGSGPLVSTDWLEKNLRNPKLRVIEVSVNPGLYERGHIPGAVNFSWHNDLNDRVRRDIVSQAEFEKLLSAAGVDKDTTVILYGDTNNWFAAWGAWVFDQYGVQNVKLLDGGRKKWEAENRVLDNRAPEHVATRFKVTQPNPQCARGWPTCWPWPRAAPMRSWSTSARPTSTAARSSRRPAPPNWRCARATCPARRTCPGAAR